MPPRKKPSAPAGRVYKHQQPLQQAKFPAQKKIVKTYGSRATRQLPRLVQQETLTQMDFVRMKAAEVEEEEEEDEDEIEEVVEVEEVEQVDDDEEVEIVKPQRKRRRSVVDLVDGLEEEEDVVEVVKHKRKRRRAKVDLVEDGIEAIKPKGRRRRTMGDMQDEAEEEEHGIKTKKAPEKSKKTRRKTTGDKPSSGPQYHTQTITQLDWSVMSAQGDEEDGTPEQEDLPQREDVDTSFDDAIFDVPSSSQALPLPKTTARKSKQATIRAHSPRLEKNTAGLMGPPQTPKRILVQEIPSSESPATPLSVNSVTYGRRSPLKNVPVNSPIPPLNLHPARKTPGSEYQLPVLEIKDTFDTSTDVSQMTGIPTTPSKKSSPPKSVRFAIPEPEPSPTEERSPQHQTPTPTESDPTPTEEPSSPRIATQATPIFSKMEIMDSDEESDGDYMEDFPVEVRKDALAETEDVPQQDTCYGDLGEETQFEVERILGTSSLSRAPEDSQVERHDTPALEQDSMLLGSPTLTHVEESQIEDDTGNMDLDYHPSHFEAKTQFTESQRLHTQHYAAMAPRTISSDVFVSLPSQQVKDIIDRKRDHDVRNWAYPSTVSRIWIYVAKPVGALKYMAVISSAKFPGEIEDEAGLGNKVFNNKKANSTWRAYKILELYELADPLPLAKLLENEWLQEAPKKHMPVRPAVIDSLMANLMPPIFDQFTLEEDEDDEGDAEITPSTMNDTQEAEAQLLSTMKQFVQIEPIDLAGSSQHSPSHSHSRIPSSQEEMMLPPPLAKPAFHNNNTDILSQATTVDLTQTQPPTQTQIRTPRKLPPTRDIIWESPSRPVFTSTPAPRSGASDVLAPYSIASSQIVSETQMQREGVVFYDSIPAPPDFIQDSDDDDEDEL